MTFAPGKRLGVLAGHGASKQGWGKNTECDL